MAILKFSIITPERKVLEREVDEVTLPTQQGEIGILPGHIPLVGLLKPGTINIKNGDHQEILSVAQGFFEISETEVKILADTAERAEELDIGKIELAKQRAEKALEEARNREDVDYTGLTATLERELARLKTAHKHHSRRHTPGLQ